VTPLKRFAAPIRKMSAANSTPGTRAPLQSIRAEPAPRLYVDRDVLPVAEIEETGNVSRARAGAGPGENGFTCVRCLQWFPAGTQHACRAYADVIRNPETVAPTKGPMTAEEIVLLQQDGQL